MSQGNYLLVAGFDCSQETTPEQLFELEVFGVGSEGYFAVGYSRFAVVEDGLVDDRVLKKHL